MISRTSSLGSMTSQCDSETASSPSFPPSINGNHGGSRNFLQQHRRALLKEDNRQSTPFDRSSSSNDLSSMSSPNANAVLRSVGTPEMGKCNKSKSGAHELDSGSTCTAHIGPSTTNNHGIINSRGLQVDEQCDGHPQSSVAPVLDPAAILSIIELDDDPEHAFSRSLLSDYAHQGQSIMASMHNSIYNSNFDQVGSLALLFKDSSLSLGANRVAKVCDHLLTLSNMAKTCNAPYCQYLHFLLLGRLSYELYGAQMAMSNMMTEYTGAGIEL